MSIAIAQKKGVSITVAANDKLAVYSAAPYKVLQVSQGSPNIPANKSVLFSGSGAYLSSAFSAATPVIIQMGDRNGFYATGTAPAIPESVGLEVTQAAPGTLNATGTLTGALILGGIVTSTTGAAVTAALDTGTVMDQVVDSAAVNEGFMWSAINTGGANAFTVTASTGHTIVGAGAVAASTSGRFLTRRTAAATWVTYRIS
jgi:hypothetical protein